MVLFPLEDGCFKSNQRVMETTYEVHGQPAIIQGEATAASNAPQLQSPPGVPFGSYTSPTFSLPPTHPPRPKVTINKTIVLVSLQLKESQAPSSSKASKIDFQIVTNIVLTLEPSQCNLAAVEKLVAHQLKSSCWIAKSIHCFRVMLLVVLNFGKAHERCWQHQKHCTRNAQDIRKCKCNESLW